MKRITCCLNNYFRLALACLFLISASPVMGQTDVPSTSQDAGSAETSAQSTNSDNAAPPAETTAPDSSQKETKTLLQGGVRGAVLRTVEGLETIESSAKLVQNSVFEIMKECTRKETVVARGPNYIGNGIVIPAVGDPSGIMQVGDLPARRDHIEAFLSTSEEALNALQSHVTALIIPENPSEELSNLLTGMRSTMSAARGNMDKMKELAGQQKLNKKQIGSTALKIYDSMTALEKMRLQVLKLVQST